MANKTKDPKPDPPEFIDRCLHCKFAECNNCLAKEKKGTYQNYGLILYEGEYLSISDIAEKIGMSTKGLYGRIERGGLDYALSPCRTMKEWQSLQNLHPSAHAPARV